MLDSQLADHLAFRRPGRAPPALTWRQIRIGWRRSNGPWHIRVYSVVDLDGARSISPGLEPTAATVLPGPHPEVTVSYISSDPGFRGFRGQLTFRTDPPGTSIPPMVLVAHQRVVPLSVDDGQIVARFPSGSDGASSRSEYRRPPAATRPRVP